MELRELSKLQIRAEVLTLLQQISVATEITKVDQDNFIEQLGSITDRSGVLDILAKELPKVDDRKSHIISFFLVKLGSLEQLREILWSYIQNPSSTDSLREISSTTLRLLGEAIAPEDLLNYFDNPKEVIDKETQKLLNTAIINPEAQIDFLDFLFTIPEYDQIQLIDSLKDDYPNEDLANILIPALEARPQSAIAETITDILGQTKSPLAVPVLKNLIKYFPNDKLAKLAQKNLNLLKISGVNIDNCESDLKNTRICRFSQIFECYTNMIDGTGNQGIIVSRIKKIRTYLCSVLL